MSAIEVKDAVCTEEVMAYRGLRAMRACSGSVKTLGGVEGGEPPAPPGRDAVTAALYSERVWRESERGPVGEAGRLVTRRRNGGEGGGGRTKDCVEAEEDQGCEQRRKYKSWSCHGCGCGGCGEARTGAGRDGGGPLLKRESVSFVKGRDLKFDGISEAGGFVVRSLNVGGRE